MTQLQKKVPRFLLSSEAYGVDDPSNRLRNQSYQAQRVMSYLVF